MGGVEADGRVIRRGGGKWKGDKEGWRQMEG